MAIINSPLLGKVSKSIDNITFSKYEDKIVLKRKVVKNKKRNKKSKQQIVQQKRFKYASEFACYFHEGLKYAYPNKSNSFLHNIFIKINREAVTVDPETFITEIDYTKFLCSDGDLLPPDVSVKVEDENSVFTVEHFTQTVTPLCRHDDDVYILFLAPQMHDHEHKVFYLGKRCEPEVHKFSLFHDVYYNMAFVFAVSRTGKYRSRSVYTFLDIGEGYIDIKNYPRDFEVFNDGQLLRIPPSIPDIRILEKINDREPKVTKLVFSESDSIEVD